MKYFLDKMDFDGIEISYIGEEEATDDVDDNEDLNEDYEPRQESPRHGKDLHWTKNINFNNARIWKKIILSCY